MERIDRKFQFTAYKTKDPTSSVSENDAMVFKCSDNAVPAMLKFYYAKCDELGASEEQLKGIMLLAKRVNRWRELNSDKCKVADVDEGHEQAVVCSSNE